MNEFINKKTEFIDLGLQDYKQAWDYQTSLLNATLAIKQTNRNLPVHSQQPTRNYLLFCEHPHVYTLGKSGDENNLLATKEKLSTLRATYYQTNRGGDITYHGPGQLVVYPVLDLENFFTDIHQYMRLLEEAVILTCRDYGLKAGRIEKLTGVWIDCEDPLQARKICALGVKTSRWVTLHGLALNVNTELSYFNHIIPCGIDNKAVTSMEKELGRTTDIKEVGECLKRHLVTLFKMDLV